MPIIGGNSVQPFNVTAKEKPAMGTLAVPDTIDLTTTNVVQRDYSALQNERRFTCIQCIYVDNSQNTTSFSALMSDTNQLVTWPAGYQGYVNVQATNNMKITFLCIANVKINVMLLNYDQGTRLWSANASADQGSTGYYFDTGGTTAFQVLQLWNPPNSGKSLTIEQIIMTNQGTAVQNMLFGYNATQNSAVSATTPVPAATDGAPSVAMVNLTNPGAFIGGIMFRSFVPAMTTLSIPLNQPIIIRPGHGFQAQFVNTQTLVLDEIWTEQ